MWCSNVKSCEIVSRISGGGGGCGDGGGWKVVLVMIEVEVSPVLHLP